MLDMLLDSWKTIYLGLGFGVVLGLLWGIQSLLRRIWSTLLDIERNTRNWRAHNYERYREKD